MDRLVELATLNRHPADAGGVLEKCSWGAPIKVMGDLDKQTGKHFGMVSHHPALRSGLPVQRGSLSCNQQNRSTRIGVIPLPLEVTSR